MSVRRDPTRVLRACFVLLLSASLPVVSGCKTGTIGRKIEGFERIVRGKDTKESVYRRFGVPDDIYSFPRGSTLLVYERQEDVGMTVGGGLGAFPLLVVGHSHVGTDSAYVIVDARGIVTDVGIRRQSDLASQRLWPFGE